MIVDNTDRVLVVCAHSDDEALGCGGTLSKWISLGVDVSAVFLTNGVSSRSAASPEDVDQRYKALNISMKTLGIKKFENFEYPDNELDRVAMLELAKTVENIINKFRPTIILTHSRSDLNVDHLQCVQAVLVASRPQPDCPVKAIASFEVVSSTEWNFGALDNFKPNLFIDITDHIETKIKSCLCYEKEMRARPHARSIENIRALAMYRGSTVGVDFAESFEILRLVN